MCVRKLSRASEFRFGLDKFDWEPHYEKLPPIQGERMRTAVAITCYNRPGYAEEVFNALSVCDRLSEYPVYCFIDNSKAGGEKLQNRLSNLVSSKIPGVV